MKVDGTARSATGTIRPHTRRPMSRSSCVHNFIHQSSAASITPLHDFKQTNKLASLLVYRRSSSSGSGSSYDWSVSPSLDSCRKDSDGRHDPAEDSDDYETSDEGGDESQVQLGTAVALDGSADALLFKSIDWHDWDGGKAGGWPVWLNPRDLPAPEEMRCGHCAHPLSFLIQLYCPLDHEEDAFHRCLYVFCCSKATCSGSSSVRALRCQLPRDNDFYPFEPDQELASSKDEKTKQRAGADPAAWDVKLCLVCGQRARSSCSKCKTASYCGRQHQAEHWKQGGHKKACTGMSQSKDVKEDLVKDPHIGGNEQRVLDLKRAACASQTMTSSFVYREFEVQVRPEPASPALAPDGRTLEDALASKLDFGGAGAYDTAQDEDAKLSQAELDKIAGVHGVKDKITLKFLARTQSNPQVVRYDTGGGGPLWSSSQSIPTDADVPPCERCGQARKFEFQVMPQLLHHLGVEANTQAPDPHAAKLRAGGTYPLGPGECMDWGTLAVYTCPDSCPTGGRHASIAGTTGDAHVAEDPPSGYTREFVWRQPPP